jgi:hypothetical protein
MIRSTIFAALICFCLGCATSVDAAETTFVIDRPCLDIVRGLYAEFSDERPAGFADYLPRLFLVHLRFTFTAYPASHYYRFDTILLEPAGRVVGLHKTLEVWADNQHGRTIFRNRLVIEPKLPQVHCSLVRRIVERIGARLADEAARGVIATEDAVIRRMANER